MLACTAEKNPRGSPFTRRLPRKTPSTEVLQNVHHLRELVSIASNSSNNEFHSNEIVFFLCSPFVSSFLSAVPSARPHLTISLYQLIKLGAVLAFHFMVIFLLAKINARFKNLHIGPFFVPLVPTPSIQCSGKSSPTSGAIPCNILYISDQ